MKNLSYIVIQSLLLLFYVTSNSQNQFTNTGNFKIHNGTSISFFGDFINNGSYVDSGLVTTLKGNAAQQIGGSSITAFKNLTLDNSAGSYLSSNQSIQRELNITSGTFSTTGYDFTLLSDINGTARIAPIQGDFSGNITMQRYLGAGLSDWRFLASPVLGVTLADWQDDFVTSGFPGSTYPSFPFVSIYTYDESVTGISDYGYNTATDVTNPITPGVGYWCYIGPVPLTVDLTGPPAKFTQTFSVSYTPDSGPSEDGYVMIGNPYPSPIDWSSSDWTKNNINDAVYIWNPALQQYASWVSGVATNGGSNIIASSQSFWIQTNAASPSLSCNENIKVSSSQAFLRPANQNIISESSQSANNLKLSISGNGYSDETILQFGYGGTNGYDNSMDARKLFSSNASVPGIASQDATLKDLSINSLPEISVLTHIPIKTIVGVSGVYTIKIDSSSNIPLTTCLILEDLATGGKTPLTASSTYSFHILDTTQSARFILHVSPSNEVEIMNASCNNSNDGKIIAKGTGIGPWNYSWFSSTNNVIKQTTNSFYYDSLQNLNAGSYSVQITDAAGMCGSLTKEISILPLNSIYAGFTLAKDTVYADEDQTIVFQNNSIGATSYAWNFGDGSPEQNYIQPTSHLYSSEGMYAIRLIAKYNGCSDTLQKQLVVLPANYTGLNEYDVLSGISVFPNPSKGVFNIQLNDQGWQNAVIEIRTTTGALIYKVQLDSPKKQINLQNLAKGVYIYQIALNNSSYERGKIIIE
jgi:hypothetical protein